MAGKRERRRSPGRRRRPWLTAAVILVFLLSIVGIAGTVYAIQLLNQAKAIVPTLPEKMSSLVSEPTVIVSADGKELLRMFAEYRQEIKVSEVPQHVLDAFISAEDRRFYLHRGVDLWALGRVASEVLTRRGESTGGSTLTMQLAKRFYTSPERNVERKLKDMALAYMMEQMLEKDQILELYLNQVYFGEQAYGLGAAADIYFGKEVKDLTISEAAMLARCVRRPSDENPRENYEKAVQNRNIVLKIMLDDGKITKAQYDEALAEEIKLSDKTVQVVRRQNIAPFFVDYVLRELRRLLPPDVDVKRGGYRVETTLHADVQRESEAQLLRTIRSYRSVRTGAAVVLDRDGRIVSMIGGPDYSESQFNSAVDGRRQPGSSFKPFVYATALKRGLIGGAGSLVSNRRVTVRENGRTRTIKSGGPAGSVSMEQAMAYSYNSAAWNTMRMAGPANVVNVSRTDFGMTGLLPAVPSLALGTAELSPLEMAAAYSVFQRAGERVEPFAIERVLGPTGLPIYVADPKSIRTGISATMAGAIDQSLQAVVEYGTGKRASGVKNARGKTGTTNDNRDAWFCGYTNDYVGVVWVANPITRADGRRVYSPMTVMGGEVAAPAWGRIMRGVQAILGERSPKSDYGAASRRTRRVRDTSDETDAPGRAEREADNAPVSAGDEGRDGTQAGAQAPALTEEPTRQPAAETRPDPPRNDPPPVRPPQEPAPAAEPEEVLVTVCVDSGQRATGYCPETVRRRFPRGQEPKGRCPIHRP